MSAAIELKPEDPVLHYNRGFYHEIVGDRDAALADYSRAVVIDPEFLEAYEARGWVHECNGSREEAVENYRVYAESKADPDPGRVAAYNSLIEILQQTDTCSDTAGVRRTMETFYVAQENENWDDVARCLHSQVLHDLQSPIDPRQRTDRQISLWKRRDPVLRSELAAAPPGRFYRLIREDADRGWPGEPTRRCERMIGISCRGRGHVTIRYLITETLGDGVHYSIASDNLKMESGLWKLTTEEEDFRTITPLKPDFLENDW